MNIFGICLISAGAITLLLAGWCFGLYIIFEHHKELTGQTGAFLKSSKHRKNVPLYDQRYPASPIRIVKIIRNWSRGLYYYCVNGKTYRIRYIRFVTKKQLPRIVHVVYCKCFPKFAYVKSDTSSHAFEIYALAFIACSVLLMSFGIPMIL